jgi:four helix bundle protein
VEQGNRQSVGPGQLVAYRVALEAVAALSPALERARRFDSDLADHMRRALTSVVLSLAEGAGRETARDKARFYAVARASGYEVMACIDLIEAYRLRPDGLASGRSLLDRVLAMLSRLVQHAA